MKAIAYIDKDGNDFQGDPWIQTIPAGREPEDELRDFFEEHKCQKAVLFELSPHLMPEIKWEDVDKTAIDTLIR